MGKRNALGKGFEAIFADNTVYDKNQGIVNIKLDYIEPNKEQPRKEFDDEALNSLAVSIKENGVLQPIIVREKAEDRYDIIAGERRWRASRIAGLEEIPCIITDADEYQSSKIALIENLQRQDLSTYEVAVGLSELSRKYSLTQEEIAKAVGGSRSSVANYLRLLDLPKEALALLKERKLSAGHCKALLGLEDQEKIVPVSIKIVARNLSVRETEALVRRENSGKSRETEEKDPMAGIEDVAAARRAKVNYYEALERRIADKTGRQCRVIKGAKKKVISFPFSDDNDLNVLIEALSNIDLTKE